MAFIIGNWMRYASTRVQAPAFSTTILGQILIGHAQPFVLSVLTHYFPP